MSNSYCPKKYGFLIVGDAPASKKSWSAFRAGQDNVYRSAWLYHPGPSIQPRPTLQLALQPWLLSIVKRGMEIKEIPIFGPDPKMTPKATPLQTVFLVLPSERSSVVYFFPPLSVLSIVVMTASIQQVGRVYNPAWTDSEGFSHMWQSWSPLPLAIR